MSRVGKLPVEIPGNVKVNLLGRTHCGGSKRTLSSGVSPGYPYRRPGQAGVGYPLRRRYLSPLTARLDPGPDSEHDDRVTKGYTKELELVGVDIAGN